MKRLHILRLFVLYVIKCGAQTDEPADQQDGVNSPPTLAPPDPGTSPDYSFNYDYSDYFTMGGEYCLAKETCDSNYKGYQSFPEKNCYCDPLCVLTNDCCPGFNPLEADIPKYSSSVFECIRFEDGVKYPGYGVTMVTKCDIQWPEGDVKENCEDYTRSNNTFLTVPVSEPIHNILFRNMYCSICNYNYDYKLWKMAVRCRNDSEGSHDCISEFQHPQPTIRNRLCPLQAITDSCPSNYSGNKSYVEECINGSYSLTYFGFSSNIYKNKYCALCDGIPMLQLLCEPEVGLDATSTRKIDPRLGYSFRMLVDFNSDFLTDSDGVSVSIAHRCQDNEIYDPVVEICREILCPAPLTAVAGKCIFSNSSDSSNTIPPPSDFLNCTPSKLEPSEYERINKSHILILSSQTMYGEEMSHVSDSGVFMCLDINQTCRGCKEASVMFTFDETEIYLSFITTIISLVALALTFSVYIYFSELQNTPGKILICLIVSLFFAQLLFIVTSTAQNYIGSCKTLSILMHYFFLAAFCWMNIVALDLWVTFSNQFITPGSGSKSVKRFLRFSVYGWGLPLLIVSAAVIIDSVDLDEDFINLQPNYGESVCWITSRDALLLFFAGPLAVFKFFDIVAFVFTSIHIIRAKRQGAMARQKSSTCSFLINIKLSLVMGLTWVFAFLANMSGLSTMWYLFIIFNCLQGLFIAISFLCTTKVKRLVRSKYEEVSKSRSSTQMTSLNPSSEHK